MVDDRPIIKIETEEDASKVLASFIENKDIRYFEPFREYISKQFFSSIKVSIDDLSALDISVGDESLLDYIIDNHKFFSYEIKEKILESIPVIKHIIETGKLEILKQLSEETMFLEYEPGKTLFEYLLENDLLTSDNIERIYGHFEYLNKLREKDINLLKLLNSYSLLNYKIGDVSAIEFLFQNQLVDAELVQKFYSNREIYLLCVKYNRDDLLENLQEGVLKEKIEDKTVLEYLLDKGILPKEKYYSNKELIKILLDHKKFEVFVDSMESGLLEKVDGEKTVLEILLDNGVIPTTSFYRKKESLAIFLNYGVYSKICDYNVDTLLSLYDLNNTYLDFVLDRMDEGLDFQLSKISTFSDDKEKLAKFYITIARRGYIKHIDNISEYSLTKDNGKLLKKLLEVDKDLTLNVVIPDHIKEELDVAVLLRLNGVEQKDVKVDLHAMNILGEYFEKYNSQFRNYELDPESQSLINEFKDLMLSDGKSDPKLIDAYVTTYTYLLATRNPLGEKELRKLIEIKKNDPNFVIVEDKTGSFYREHDNSIHLENVGLNTLNHETGHALYHNLTDVDVPSEYESIIYEIRNNPQTIIKVGNYSAKFQEIRRKVTEFVDTEYMSDYHMSEEELASLDEFLNKQKEEHRAEYIKEGYDEATIDAILGGIFSREEYIEQDKRIKREELIDAIMRSEYGAFITIGDILDSIYIGRFKGGEVRNQDHNAIAGAYGHGIAYYNRGIRWSFDETMANFSAIMKSVDAREIMSYLQDIVGERFMNCISEYYMNQIVNSTKKLGSNDLNSEEVQSL